MSRLDKEQGNVLPPLNVQDDLICMSVNTRAFKLTQRLQRRRQPTCQMDGTTRRLEAADLITKQPKRKLLRGSFAPKTGKRKRGESPVFCYDGPDNSSRLVYVFLTSVITAEGDKHRQSLRKVFLTFNVLLHKRPLHTRCLQRFIHLGRLIHVMQS